MRIFLTGATGYVGGRLLKTLESRGYQVCCLARKPEFLRDKAAAATKIRKGDLLDERSLEEAMAGCDTAYYLAHSMGSKGRFDKEEMISASHFVNAGRKTGLKRIIYLGGIGRGDNLSPHLKSRSAVGNILRESGIPTIEFQASIVIGSGSLSFEMIRSLVERLPVMMTPKWVNVLAQPIGIEDVIQYLSEALSIRLDESRIYEIGGPDRMSYLDLMKEYGRQRGLRRLIIRVPVLTPGLSSLWLGLITPLYARIGRKLIESIRHESIVKDDRALKTFSVKPMSIRTAMERALSNEERDFSQTRWSDALSSSYKLKRWGGVRFGSRLLESNTLQIPTSKDKVFDVVMRIGGKNGWYHADWIWRIRGFIDLLAGGIGMRRGRRIAESLSVGDTVDWWRVEAIEPGSLLRLSAEMKLPGRAWLQFEVKEQGEHCTLHQTAIFDPLGLWGIVYWYGLYPFHRYVFTGMLKGIVNRIPSKTLENKHIKINLT
jgi:uncharacterized protein YbjT (DUF2867 family)